MNTNRSLAPYVALAVGILAGFIAAAIPFTRNPAFLILIMVGTLVGGVVLFVALVSRDRRSPGKTKRGQTTDVYALIDRLLVELSPDELAYLRRRLEESAQPGESDAIATLESLLDERQNRRAPER